MRTIKVELTAEEYEIFLGVKDRLGLRNNSEVIRVLIKRAAEN